MSRSMGNSQSPAPGSPDSNHNDSESAAGTAASERPAVAAARHGPMTTIAYDQPVALTTSGGPLLNLRSCVACRKRKVRCDRTMPCTNCRRAQITCVYPAPGRAPRRPRPRDPNALPKPGTSEREAELMKRLRKLEGIVDELSTQIDAEGGSSVGARNSRNGESPEAMAGGGGSGGRRSGSAGSSAPSQGINAVRGAAEDAKRGTKDSVATNGLNTHLGRLVLHDGGRSARYVNSGFMSTLNHEFDELRREMQAAADELGETDYYDSSPGQSPEPYFAMGSDHQSFLMGYRSADVDLTPLHPLPAHALLLWQVYQENVESLLKTVHVPTMDRLIRDMEKRMEPLGPGDEALIFAIYYAAVTSMEDDEIQASLGASQAHYVSQFRFAIEQALAKANLLNTSDMAVLQAFTIFLTVVKRHDDSKFCWTMTGLCVRMAQGLGLHRDGVQLGLPPFEVEMRRRLWWAIMAIDLRAAEELGTDLAISEACFDTQLPSNINDVDIDPSFTEMPTPREGRTDTAAALVRIEICALSRRLFFAVKEMRPTKPQDVAKNLEDRERMLIEVFDRIEEKFLKHAATDDDPLYWMASLVARVKMAKTGLIIYQPVLFPGTGPELSNEIRSRLWVSCIEIVEYNHILNIDPRCRSWRWLFQSYRQWHAIAFMLLELSRRPWTVTSERAWEAAQILGHDHPMQGTKSADHTAVWMPVKRLYIKAKRHREMEVARLRADPVSAQRLDVDDRMNPLPERLGPVPGMETRMTELRIRWRRLVRADIHPTDMPQYNLSIMPDPSQSATARAQAQAHATAHHQHQDQQQQEHMVLPPQGNESDFMDGMMARPLNPNDMWHYVYTTGGGGDAHVPFEGGGGAPAPAPAATGLFPPGAGLGHHAGTISSMASPAVSGGTLSDRNDPRGARDLNPSAEDMPPWLWTNAFPGVSDSDRNNNGGDGLNGAGEMEDLLNAAPTQFGGHPVIEDVDLNMDIGEMEDIDWKNWQETLKGLTSPAAKKNPVGPARWGGM